MQSRITSVENRRGGEPQRIGEILAALLVQYEGRFPAARIAVIETPAVMEDQSCLFYPAETTSLS